jgi:hypothetical protein
VILKNAFRQTHLK